jgi:hypothetical protein
MGALLASYPYIRMSHSFSGDSTPSYRQGRRVVSFITAEDLTIKTLFDHLFWLANKGHSLQSINVLKDKGASRFLRIENLVPELRKILGGGISVIELPKHTARS